MSYKSVLTKIDELRVLVSSWQESSEPAALEMDMALERVKSIYEMLRFPIAEPQQEAETPPQEDPQEPSQECAAEQECVSEEIPKEVTEVVSEVVAEVVAEVATEEITEEAAEEATEEVSVSIEECVTELEIEEQVEDEEIHIELVNVTQIVDDAMQQSDNKRERLSRILSLYDEQIDDEQPPTAEATEPEPQPEPTPQPTPQPESTYPPIELSINDRILLSEELFGGDSEALTTELSTLCQQPTLDDAMIYIAENYPWSGDNEGAQLLMSLLQNRYLS